MPVIDDDGRVRIDGEPLTVAGVQFNREDFEQAGIESCLYDQVGLAYDAPIAASSRVVRRPSFAHFLI